MQKNILKAVVCFIFLSAIGQVHSQGYETYLESWDSLWEEAMKGMPPVPEGSETTYDNVTLDIAFASYTFPGLNGVQFLDPTTDVNEVLQYVHGQNGKVKISYGGASYAGPNYFISQTEGWPDNIPDLVEGVASVVTSYGFDGVDFDIEDPLPNGMTAEDFANQLFSFLTQIRQALPEAVISLTIPGQGWGTYWQYLAQKVAAAATVNCINFMEYDIWVGAPTYVDQIKADLLTYQSSPAEPPQPPNYSPGWGLPASIIQLGLMPGNDDTGQFLSVDDAKLLTEYVMSAGLFGVMTWDLDRDAGTDPVPTLDGALPYAYSEGIRTNLYQLGNTKVTFSNKARKVSRRFYYRISPFVRKDPPQHGAPA